MTDARATILEGPDGGGKSTLARYLGGPVDHHGPYPDVRNLGYLYLRSLERARRASPSGLVLDRSWLSEPIYARAVRDAPSRIDVASRRMLEREAWSVRAVVALVLPSIDVCAEAWRARVGDGDEYVTRFRAFQHVYEAYLEIALTTSSDGSASGWTDLPVVVVNRERDTLRAMRNRLDDARARACPPNLGPGAGRFARGNVLLVGERENLGPESIGGPARPWQRPFVRFVGGCASWFADRLEEAGVAERELYFVNAEWPDGRPTSPGFLAELEPRAVVALGRVAAAWCRDVARVGDFHEVDHPQAWKRFHHHERYPLLDVFEELRAPSTRRSVR